MNLQIPNCTVLLLCLFFFSSSALPFFSFPKIAGPLLNARASYSVVPVDGRPQTGAVGGAEKTTTITENVVVTITASPMTKTVTVVSTLIQTEDGPISYVTIAQEAAPGTVT